MTGASINEPSCFSFLTRLKEGPPVGSAMPSPQLKKRLQPRG
jgi:hypothetical protein